MNKKYNAPFQNTDQEMSKNTKKKMARELERAEEFYLREDLAEYSHKISQVNTLSVLHGPVTGRVTGKGDGMA